MSANSGEAEQNPSVVATITLKNPSKKGDSVNSEEQQEALKKVEARKTLLKPLIDSVIPDKPVEHFNEVIATRYGKTVDEMDDEDRGEARNAFNSARFNKQQSIDRIAQKQIPDVDLEPYIAALHSTARTLFPANREVDTYTMMGFVNAAESVEQARLHLQLAEQWRDKFLVGVDDKILKTRAATFQELIAEITGSNILAPRPEPRPPEQTIQLFQAFTEVYDYIYSLPKDQQNGEIVRTFTNAAKRVGLEFNDSEQTRRMMRLLKEVAAYPDQEMLKKFANAATRYSFNHGLTEDTIRGFVDKLLPAIQSKDPQIELLLRGGNIWGMHKGGFGAGDFITHAYAVRINPSNVNELLLAAREVPATNLARLEQNRLDALTMTTPFGILRDFIHDQRPYVHEVLVAMVHYYDTGDRSKLETILSKTDYFNSAERHNMMFDRTRYDMEVEETIKDWHTDEQGNKVKSIDVLRRLVENTKPIPDLPPLTSDDELNAKLQALAESKTGKAPPKGTLASTVDYVNAKLIDLMARGGIGIEPNYILALSWLERRGFEVLQGLKYEDQMGTYKQDWFLSLLKFQELTASSSDFNETEFNAFIGQLKNAPSGIEAYRMISKRILEHINALARKYKESGRTNTGALWSGNMAHEFIGLVDFRSATTQQGKRVRGENIKQLVKLGYHPGD